MPPQSWVIPERDDIDTGYGSTNDVPQPPAEAEAYFITALCATGTYDPASYGVTPAHFHTFTAEDATASSYQKTNGVAPPLEWLRKRHPSLPVLTHISPISAAQDVIDNHRSWVLRSGVATALPLMSISTTDAIDALARTLDSLPSTAVAPPVSAGDDSLVREDDSAVPHIPVPGEMLTRYTSGMALGRLWYIGARYGVGKTWQLIRHAMCAADAGFTVHFFSLEMPKIDMASRMRWLSMGTHAYHSATPKEQAHALAERLEIGGGDILIHDPTSGSVTADTIRSVAGEQSLAIVDYLGLMKTRSGAASVEDWRTAATITNELREVSLATSMPVLGAVQLSRQADNARKLSGAHISQTDFAGMDADLIYMLQRSSSRVRKVFLDKNRHGQDKVTWYSKFDVPNQTYDDISPELAATLRLVDEETEEAV